MIAQGDDWSLDEWAKTIRITSVTITYTYEQEEPYHLCNTHLRTWRAYNSTEDLQRARITNNKDK